VIVGVAGDARHAFVGGDVDPLVYVPAIPATGMLHVRAPTAPTRVLSDLRRAVEDVDASLAPYFTGRTMREHMASSLLPAQITQVVLGVAGGVALLLAAGGLYGLVAYTLQQRLKEIGIRVALGATRRNVFGVVVGGAVRLTAVGVVFGILAGAAATRLLGALLFAVSPTDPLTFGLIAVLLVLVTLGAGYAAARRGLATDPVVVLRSE
jgi:putative ABC transport system permease protein